MNNTDDFDLLDTFTTDFCSIVSKHCSYVIVSGFLAISSGRSRGTEDIDIILPKLSLEEFKILHEDLCKTFTVLTIDDSEVKDIYGYLIDANVRYVYKDSILPNMEVKFAKSLIDIDNLEHRKKYSLTGPDVYFAPLECAILYKELLLGSDKDLEDALHLRKVYDSELSNESFAKYERLFVENERR
jgi:hypothetical protein